MTTGTRHHILIVADAALREQLDGPIQVEPTRTITTRHAATGAEGLRGCASERPDCIVLDPLLPDMDGSTFLAQLSAAHGPDTIPVVILAHQALDEAQLAGAQMVVRLDQATPQSIALAIRAAIEIGSLRRALTDAQPASAIAHVWGRFLDGILNNVPILLYRLNALGVVTNVVGRGLQLPGLSPSTIIGAVALERFPSFPLPFASASIPGTRHFVSQEDHAGATVYLEHYLFADDDVGVMGIAIDCTTHVEAKLALRASQEQLHMIWEAATDAMVLSDPDGIVLMANPAYCQLYGQRDEEVVGRAVAYLFTDVEPTQAQEHYAHLFHGPLPRVRLEAAIRRVDGGAHVVEAQVTFLIHDGHRAAMLSVLRDVTATKVVEQQLQETNTRLQQTISVLEQRTLAISILNELNNLLKISQTPSEAYTIVAQLGRQIFPTFAGALYVLNTAETAAEAVAGWGEEMIGPWACSFPPSACWALRRGRPHLVPNTHTGVRCDHLITPFPATTLCVPIISQGKVSGCLHLYGSTPRSVTDTEWQMAMAVSEQIELTITNLALRETLREQSQRDPLTGLYNRRWMHEMIERELARAARQSSPLSVVMLDIDHFKQVNDTYGHAAGDMALCNISTTILRNVRHEDSVYRYGGEELLILMPGAALADARERAEQLRVEIRQLSLHHEGKSLGRVTVSLGVATCLGNAVQTDALINAADHALYQAKVRGRDQVAVAEVVGGNAATATVQDHREVGAPDHNEEVA